MRYFLFILLSFNLSFAQSLFWKDIGEVRDNYIILDENEIKDVNETQINKIIEQKNIYFNKIIETLKQNPYDLSLDNNFINKDIESEKNKLIQRIKVNKQYKYNIAITRDEIKFLDFELKEKIYTYFLTLANSWTYFSKEDLDQLNQEYMDYLTSINYDKFYQEYKSVLVNTGEIEKELKNNFIEFKKDYFIFSEILNYIILNETLFKYKSLTNFLKLGVIIDLINSDSYSNEINIYLRFIYTDVGRLSLFTTVIFLFFLLNILINKRIYKYLKQIVIDKKEENEDLILDNLNKIRRPIFLIINAIGLKLAIEVLVYPNSINDYLNNIFFLFYILAVIYIFFIIIDNMLFLYLSKKNENESIRKELLSFMTTISKTIIFLIGFLLFLIKCGVDISGILASLGIGGLAVAFAAQSTLANFFGLLKIIVDNSFSQGDWIVSGDIEGTVVEIGFISTKVRTFDNALITVPNSTLANSDIKNWNKRKIGRRIKMHIGVTYDSNKKDLHKSISEIRKMLIEHKDIVTSQEVKYSQVHRHYKQEGKLVSLDDKYGVKTNLLVYLDNLSPYSIDILVYAFTTTIAWDNWLSIKEDIIFKIWEILERNNLEFAFPTQTLHIDNKEEK